MDFVVGGLHPEKYNYYLNPKVEAKIPYQSSGWISLFNLVKSIKPYDFTILMKRTIYFIKHQFKEYPNNIYLFQRFKSHQFTDIVNNEEYKTTRDIFKIFKKCSEINREDLSVIKQTLKQVKQQLDNYAKDNEPQELFKDLEPLKKDLPEPLNVEIREDAAAVCVEEPDTPVEAGQKLAAKENRAGNPATEEDHSIEIAEPQPILPIQKEPDETTVFIEKQINTLLDQHQLKCNKSQFASFFDRYEDFIDQHDRDVQAAEKSFINWMEKQSKILERSEDVRSFWNAGIIQGYAKPATCAIFLKNLAEQSQSKSLEYFCVLRLSSLNGVDDVIAGARFFPNREHGGFYPSSFRCKEPGAIIDDACIFFVSGQHELEPWERITENKLITAKELINLEILRNPKYIENYTMPIEHMSMAGYLGTRDNDFDIHMRRLDDPAFY